jgi:hypothetical protein
MLPRDFTPDDSDEVRAFTWSPNRPGLLSPANLWTERAQDAQEALARRLREDAQDPAFCSKYGPLATRQALALDDQGFQIHHQKLAQPLGDALRSTGLAWEPHSPETYDERAEYVELHPRVGEAVMSTLAIAAATGEGLDIVGDDRSGRLHDCLLQRRAEEIYDAWLHPPALQPAPLQPDAREISLRPRRADSRCASRAAGRARAFAQAYRATAGPSVRHSGHGPRANVRHTFATSPLRYCATGVATAATCRHIGESSSARGCPTPAKKLWRRLPRNSRPAARLEQPWEAAGQRWEAAGQRPWRRQPLLVQALGWRSASCFTA